MLYTVLESKSRTIRFVLLSFIIRESHYSMHMYAVKVLLLVRDAVD